MKRIVMPFFLSVLIFIGCQKNKHTEPSNQLSTQILFDAQINQLKNAIEKSAFDENDQIGVFIRGDQQKDNLCYLAHSNNSNKTAFTSASEDDKLIMSEGQTVRFSSYAPYQALSGAVYPINLISNQVDLLFALTNPFTFGGEQNRVTFSYEHKLTVIRFKLKDDTKSFNTLKLNNVACQGSMDLTNGKISNITKGDLPFSINQSNGQAEAFVISGDLKESEIAFTISGKGLNYKYRFPATTVKEGYSYLYTITLNANSEEAVIDDATITPINDGGNTDINADVDKGSDQHNDNSNPTTNTTIQIVGDKLVTVEPMANSLSFDVTLSNSVSTYSTECSEAWVEATQSGNKVEVSIAENSSNSARSATIKVISGESNDIFTIHQKAKEQNQTTQVVLFEELFTKQMANINAVEYFGRERCESMSMTFDENVIIQSEPGVGPSLAFPIASETRYFKIGQLQAIGCKDFVVSFDSYSKHKGSNFHSLEVAVNDNKETKEVKHSGTEYVHDNHVFEFSQTQVKPDGTISIRIGCKTDDQHNLSYFYVKNIKIMAVK